MIITLKGAHDGDKTHEDTSGPNQRHLISEEDLRNEPVETVYLQPFKCQIYQKKSQENQIQNPQILFPISSLAEERDG
jgi:hypothetical protein